MKINNHPKFPQVKIFTSKVYTDERGFFTEAYNDVISQNLKVNFYQDNLSNSNSRVLRGIHYQTGGDMGKLCRVIKGLGVDFIIDLDPTSPTFGEYDLIPLSGTFPQSLWVPGSFGHAFLSLEPDTLFYYKCSSVYNPSKEIVINPFSPSLNINWGMPNKDIILSQKDSSSMTFNEYKLKLQQNE